MYDYDDDNWLRWRTNGSEIAKLDILGSSNGRLVSRLTTTDGCTRERSREWEWDREREYEIQIGNSDRIHYNLWPEHYFHVLCNVGVLECVCICDAHPFIFGFKSQLVFIGDISFRCDIVFALIEIDLIKFRLFIYVYDFVNNIARCAWVYFYERSRTKKSTHTERELINDWEKDRRQQKQVDKWQVK